MVKSADSDYQRLWPKRLIFLVIILIFSLGSVFFYINFKDDLKVLNRGNLKADNLLKEGKSFLREGKYVKAADKFESYLKKNPKSEEANFLLAQSYESIGKTKLAIEKYRKAISINPDKAEYYYYLAINLNAIKEYRPALNELKKSISINNEMTGAKIIMAEIYTELDDFDEAVKIYKQIIKEKPYGINLDQIYVELGRNYLFIKNTDQAKKSWQEALRINPQNLEAKELLAKNQ